MAVRPTFGMADLLQCSTALRKLGDGARSMEEVASETVTYLREHFVDKATGSSALPLVRFYVTRRTDQLEPGLQDFARAAGTDARSGPDVICLTLLATAGEEPAWQDRHASFAHKAIPLPSVEVLHRSPMVAQLVEQLGLDPRHLIDPDPALLHDLAERTYNVFYVPDALDSIYVPAQDSFVIPYGIRSVVGLGGLLPNGSLFAAILFSRLPVPPSAIDAFAAIALSIKVAILDHQDRVFDHESADPGEADARTVADIELAAAKLAAMSQLLDVRGAVVEREAERLEHEIADAEERAAALAASGRALRLSEARKTAIVEGALDCVIGMDGDGRITDFNRAAEETFGHRRDDVIGTLLGDTLVPYNMRERHRMGLATLRATGEGPILGRRMEVSALRSNGEEFPVELTVTQVADAQPALFTGYLRDLSASRQAAAELTASRERLAHIARTLQASFLPPALPDIEGLELAGAFQALGEGYEVGGDFYDTFLLPDRRMALVLGDVCGKGSEAAVITALARYTVRAAAMQNPDPIFVLDTLNRAVNQQYPSQFCTVVYAAVDPATATVELALGGHPHPLLVTPDGTVTGIGTSGLLLGPFARWRGTATTLVLNPGELLLLYSDGVTEARAGADFFGVDRLGDALRRAAVLDARSLVQLVEAEVLRFAGELTDDLAMLAVRRDDT